MERMFSHTGFENELSNILTVNIKLLKIRLKEKECTDWQENIVNSSKLRNIYRTEPFVEHVHNTQVGYCPIEMWSAPS